jgi:NAD(P)H-dependent FMN reductase
VTPEYNHSFPASLKTLIDWHRTEWKAKPVGFVSYGGIAGGTRALQLIKPVLSSLKLTPVTEAVNIPFVAQYINEEDRFVPNDSVERAVPTMLKELRRWAETLGGMRASAK